MTCQTCNHFFQTSDEQGLCRRFPPVPLITKSGETHSVFPPMLNEGLCGEHKEKQDA